MIINLTDTDELTDAVAKIQDELTANNTKLYFDYKDGKYGYNTDPNRGADTFNPFKSDSGGNEFNNLTTVTHILGNKLPAVIEGNGYLLIRRTGGSDTTDRLLINIDDNAVGFPAATDQNIYTLGGFYKFYFQKKIQISGGVSTNSYLYQTLLADKELEDKYVITQGRTTKGAYTQINGRGKILISPDNAHISLFYSVDNVAESKLDFKGNQYIEFNFTSRFRFMEDDSNRLYYIAYVEI